MAKTEENYTKDAIRCGHCGNLGRNRILCEYNDVGQREYESDTPFTQTWEAGTYWELVQCEACKKGILRTGDYWEGGEEDFQWTILYPVSSTSITGLPSAIQKAYDAAAQVKKVDPNAYAVLIRRLLEMVCIDKGAEGKYLAAQLKDLAEKRIIPDALTEIADKVRLFGNIGAHASVGNVKRNEISLLTKLCEAVLEYVYVAPQLIQVARETLTKRKS